MVSPRPWLVVSGALAVGVSMGAAAVTALSGDASQREVVGPGIVLTAEPSDEPNPTPNDEAGSAAASTAPEAPVERPPRGESRERPAPTTAGPAPPPAQPGPAPAPPPAPQPVTVAESDDSATEWSAESADSAD
jgi:hypothetical protein